MKTEFVDLYTLQRDLKEGLGDLFPDRIWVKAEIAQISVKGGGHCYMELVQSERGAVIAKVRAVIWRNAYALLNAKVRSATGAGIAAGKEVLVLARVNFHEVYGLSLVIDDIDTAFSVGEQELKRQQTVERLTKEGLLDRQKGLRLPELPYALAVISAEGAAGLQDFRRHLDENPCGFRYRADLFPAMMQGEGAPESIVAALEEIRAAKTIYDAVLILRGGGSDMDLVCFDDYDLAAAIARTPVPVVTAIGHDKDFHVADMVAFDHVKTPTALADLFISRTEAADERISALENRLALSFRGRLAALESRLALSEKTIFAGVRTRLASLEAKVALCERTVLSGVRNRIAGAESKVALCERTVLSGVRSRISAAESRVALLETKIAATDPRNVLKRGFSLVLDGGGVRMKGVQGRAPGDRVSVVFADGRLNAEVREVVSAENENK